MMKRGKQHRLVRFWTAINCVLRSNGSPLALTDIRSSFVLETVEFSSLTATSRCSDHCPET